MAIVKVLKCSFSEGSNSWEKDKEFNTFGKVLFKDCAYVYDKGIPKMELMGYYNPNSKFLVEGKELNHIVNHGLIEDLFWRRPHQTGETLYPEFYIVEGFSTSNASQGLFAIPVGSPLEDSIKELFPHQREKVIPNSLWETPTGVILCVDKKTFIKMNKGDVDFFCGKKICLDYFHWVNLLDRWDGRFRKKIMDVTDAQVDSYINTVVETKSKYTIESRIMMLSGTSVDNLPKRIADWRFIYQSRTSSSSHWNNYNSYQRDIFNLLFPAWLKEGDSITLDIDAIKNFMVGHGTGSDFIERFGKNVDHLYRDFLVKFYADLKVLAI